MKKLVYGLIVAAMAVGVSAFTNPNERSLKQGQYVYFNQGNEPLSAIPTTAELSKLKYTGEIPAEVCEIGTIRCFAIYTAPSQPSFNDSPVSTSNFVSIEDPDGSYQP